MAQSGSELLAQYIRADHDRIRELLAYLETHRGVKEREEKLQELFLELDAHNAAEEETVYDPLSRRAELEELIVKSEEEHSRAIEIIDELSGLNPADAEWERDFQTLQELVRSHLEKEETVLMERLSEVCAPDEIRNMAHDFYRTRQRYSGEEQPAA